ncbi:MAG: hypothetical protein ACRDAJ_17175 [Serratia fonticola]
MVDNNVLINELTELRELLTRYGVVRDSSPIEAVLSKFRRNIRNQEYGYALVDLVFINEKKNGHVRPVDISPCKEMPIEIKLGAVVDVVNSYDYDNIISMNIDIEYEADRLVQSLIDGEVIIKKAHGSWHLDYHSHGEPTSLVHPLYHFHHGGRKMYNHQDYGDVMIMDAPRVAHPPLDIILAIDFVIANFMEEEWDKLSQDASYQELLRSAQDRWWKKYYMHIVGFWNNNILGDLPVASLKSIAKKILPTLS